MTDVAVADLSGEAKGRTLIEAAPKYSSSILTMMRRTGDCPNQETGKPL